MRDMKTLTTARDFRYAIVEEITSKAVPKHVISAEHKGSDVIIKVLHKSGIRNYKFSVREGYNGYARTVQKIVQDWTAAKENPQ